MDHLLCQNTYLHPVCLAMALCEVLHFSFVSLSMLVKLLIYQFCFSVTYLKIGASVLQLSFSWLQYSWNSVSSPGHSSQRFTITVMNDHNIVVCSFQLFIFNVDFCRSTASHYYAIFKRKVCNFWLILTIIQYFEVNRKVLVMIHKTSDRLLTSI